MSTVNNQKIDTQKLLPLLESIGWTREEAERDLNSDLSKPVPSELKKHLWEIIQIARFWRQIYPQTKVTSVKYPGESSGGGGMRSTPGSGAGG